MQSDAPAVTFGAVGRNVALGKTVGRISHAPRHRVVGASGSARAPARSMIAQTVGSVSSAKQCSALGAASGATERNVALAWMVLPTFHAHQPPKSGGRACARQVQKRSLIALRGNNAGWGTMSNALARKVLCAGVSNVAPVLRKDQIFHALLLRIGGETNNARMQAKRMIARWSSAAVWARLCSVPAVACGALGRSVVQQQKEKTIFHAPRPQAGGVLGCARKQPRSGTAPRRRCLHEKRRLIAVSAVWCQDRRSDINRAGY